jgi:hypothetical protein
MHNNMYLPCSHRELRLGKAQKAVSQPRQGCKQCVELFHCVRHSQVLDSTPLVISAASGLAGACDHHNTSVAPCRKQLGYTWKQSLVSPGKGAMCSANAVDIGRPGATDLNPAKAAAALLRGRVHTCRDSRR